MRRVLLPLVFGLIPQTPALAHPHVFVTVDVTVIYEGARPAAVKLDWVYDEFFSILLTSDLGIDLDGDGILTDVEAKILDDAVVEWPADYLGDLAVEQNGQSVALAPRINHTMIYVDGIVRETHTRPLVATSDAPLTVQVYDPFYYVAYELAGPVTIAGRNDCTALITEPDLNRAYSLVDELLYGRPASDVGADEQFPEVGVEFAQTIQVICEG